MSSIGPQFYEYMKKLDENGGKLPTSITSRPFQPEFEFNNSTCNLCNGYYGPSFGEPVCVTCHEFLYPDIPHHLPNSYIFSEKTEDGDSGNDEPSVGELMYTDRRLTRALQQQGIPNWAFKFQNSLDSEASPEDPADSPNLPSHSGHNRGGANPGSPNYGGPKGGEPSTPNRGGAIRDGPNNGDPNRGGPNGADPNRGLNNDEPDRHGPNFGELARNGANYCGPGSDPDIDCPNGDDPNYGDPNYGGPDRGGANYGVPGVDPNIDGPNDGDPNYGNIGRGGPNYGDQERDGDPNRAVPDRGGADYGGPGDGDPNRDSPDDDDPNRGPNGGAPYRDGPNSGERRPDGGYPYRGGHYNGYPYYGGPNYADPNHGGINYGFNVPLDDGLGPAVPDDGYPRPLPSSLARSLAALSTPRPPDNLAPGLVEQLPSEVLLCMFSYLDDLSLCACALVCTRWLRLVRARVAQPRWAGYAYRRWPLFRPMVNIHDWHKKYQALVESCFCRNCVVQMCMQSQPPFEENAWRRNRLRNEIKMLRNTPPEGCAATPLDPKCCHWQAMVTGPVGSPYEGGVYYLYIQVPYSYPMSPPVVRFLTRILHPNVSRHGDVGIDSVHHNWSLAITISKLLISIQSLLTDPYTAVCMEPEVGEMYVNDRVRFERIARRWTWRYAMHDMYSIN